MTSRRREPVSGRAVSRERCHRSDADNWAYSPSCPARFARPNSGGPRMRRSRRHSPPNLFRNWPRNLQTLEACSPSGRPTPPSTGKPRWRPPPESCETVSASPKAYTSRLASTIFCFGWSQLQGPGENRAGVLSGSYGLAAPAKKSGSFTVILYLAFSLARSASFSALVAPWLK